MRGDGISSCLYSSWYGDCVCVCACYNHSQNPDLDAQSKRATRACGQPTTACEENRHVKQGGDAHAELETIDVIVIMMPKITMIAMFTVTAADAASTTAASMMELL
jgi:hypothetical protein